MNRRQSIAVASYQAAIRECLATQQGPFQPFHRAIRHLQELEAHDDNQHEADAYIDRLEANPELLIEHCGGHFARSLGIPANIVSRVELSLGRRPEVEEPEFVRNWSATQLMMERAVKYW